MNRIRPRHLIVAGVAAIVLFVAVGGNALAGSQGSDGRSRPAGFGKQSLRFGKLVDRDTTPFDGSFAVAFGHAACKRGERLLSGGVRQKAGNPGTDAQHIWLVESNPVLSSRSWFVKMNSDLGGAARSDFLVVANCLRR